MQWWRFSPSAQAADPALGRYSEEQGPIGESLGGDFVRCNSLTPAKIVGKLKEHNAAKALAEWLVGPAHSSQVAESVAGLIPGILDALEFEQLGCQSAVEEVPDILVIAAKGIRSG
jgi:uncharacterized membrane-anchored protein YjiN (DUF445 family)